MDFLGTYKFTPNLDEIEVDCYGTIEPAQKQTLEQEGLSGAIILESVIHNDTEIIMYLSENLLDLLNEKIKNHERNFYRCRPLERLTNFR